MSLSIFKKYASIPNLYREEAQQIYLLNDVVITEKVDGSNFSFGLHDGIPVMNTRNIHIWNIKGWPQNTQESWNFEYDGFQMKHHFLTQYGMKPFEILRSLGYDNILIYGEIYGPGINGRINYGDSVKFVFFDAYENDWWMKWDIFSGLCQKLEIPRVHCHYIGKPVLDVFEQFRHQPSVYSPTGDLAEGIVVKGLHAERDDWGERVITKYKAEHFREKGGKSIFKPSTETKDSEQYTYMRHLAELYVNRSRLDNCLEKMHSENIPVTLKTTQKVVEYMSADVRNDLEESEVEHELFEEKIFRKVVGRSSAALYHRYLQEKVFALQGGTK